MTAIHCNFLCMNKIDGICNRTHMMMVGFLRKDKITLCPYYVSKIPVQGKIAVRVIGEGHESLYQMPTKQAT